MKLHYFLLIMLLLIAGILRFYNYPYRYGLGEETVRDAVIGIEGARELQAPLTGAFSSLGPFTFGPWYAYQMILFTLFVHSLYAPWIYLTIVSILTIYILFKIGELLYGKTFGLLLAVMAAFSPPQIISATHLTSHNMTNIFAVLSLWIFLIIIKRDGSFWWGFFLGVVIGIGISLHYQMSGLLLLPLVTLFYKPKRYFYFLTAAVGVFVTFIPILMFELNNHWFNTRNLIAYFVYGKNRIYIPDRWLTYLRDFWPTFWADTFGIPKLFAIICIILFLVITIVLYRKKKIPLEMTFLFIPFAFYFLFLRYYTGPKYFGYLNFLRPFIFIFTGFTILSLKQIRFGLFISSIFIISILFFEMSQIKDELTQDSFTVSMYEQIKSLEQTFPQKKFTVYNCNRAYRNNAVVFSTVFLLDKHHKLSRNGIPVAVKSQDCNDDKDYRYIANTNFIDLSKKTSEIIRQEGWEAQSFQTIYNLNARWWFRLQP